MFFVFFFFNFAYIYGYGHLVLHESKNLYIELYNQHIFFKYTAKYTIQLYIFTLRYSNQYIAYILYTQHTIKIDIICIMYKINKHSRLTKHLQWIKNAIVKNCKCVVIFRAVFFSSIPTQNGAKQRKNFKSNVIKKA